MGSDKNKVTILYDPISPWSYLALVLLKRNEKNWNLDINLQPASLGYVFQAAGNRAPLVVRNKGKMMAQEFRMFADLYKIPASEKAWTFSMEAQQKPPNSLPLTRFLLVIQSECPSSTLDSISLSLFDIVFAQGDTSIFDSASSITDENVETLYTAINAKSVGLSKEQVKSYLEKANSKEMKEYTKEEAKKYVTEWNAYGVPHMKFERGKDGQVKHFMGSDRFELIAAWLGVPYNSHEAKAKL